MAFNPHHGLPVYQDKNIKVRYKPANRMSSLRPGSKNRSMQEFLMSNRIQKVSLEAGGAIVLAARAMAISEGLVDSGRYAGSFKVAPTMPIVALGNPRRAAKVWNDATSPGQPVSYAVVIETGSSNRVGHYILTRAGAPFHTPKGIV